MKLDFLKKIKTSHGKKFPKRYLVLVNFLFNLLCGVYFVELRLMFSLMDRVQDGIRSMLRDLEEHIISAGLADMIAAADIITTVSSHISKSV